MPKARRAVFVLAKKGPAVEPSKQYRIWQFIAAAVRPVSYVDIAVGMGMSESTVRRVVWISGE